MQTLDSLPFGAGYRLTSQHTSPRNKSSGLGYVPRNEIEVRQILDEIKALTKSANDLFVEVFKAENARRNPPSQPQGGRLPIS